MDKKTLRLNRQWEDTVFGGGEPGMQMLTVDGIC